MAIKKKVVDGTEIDLTPEEEAAAEQAVAEVDAVASAEQVVTEQSALMKNVTAKITDIHHPFQRVWIRAGIPSLIVADSWVESQLEVGTLIEV